MINRAALPVKPNVGYRCGMARDDLHFRLRIPGELKAQIEKSAAENNRSITAEIISRLERSFAVEPEWEETINAVNDLWAKMEKLEAMVRDHDEQLNPSRHDIG